MSQKEKEKRTNDTQDKSIAQLSVCARLCTMACLLRKLPAFPSLGMSPGDTSLTCTSPRYEARSSLRHFIEPIPRNAPTEKKKEEKIGA